MHSIAFDPADPKASLAQLPQRPAVFALYGADAHAEPYIGRTPNLRGRLLRLLQPSPRHPRRLQLAGRVRRIAWRLTGSDFEALLLQFELLEEVYGDKGPRAHAPARARLYPLPRRQSLPAHRGHQSPQPARSRAGPTAPSPRAPQPSASPRRRSSSFCCGAASTISIPTRATPAASTPR